MSAGKLETSPTIEKLETPISILTLLSSDFLH